MIIIKKESNNIDVNYFEINLNMITNMIKIGNGKNGINKEPLKEAVKMLEDLNKELKEIIEKN